MVIPPVNPELDWVMFMPKVPESPGLLLVQEPAHEPVTVDAPPVAAALELDAERASLDVSSAGVDTAVDAGAFDVAGTPAVTHPESPAASTANSASAAPEPKRIMPQI